MQSSMRYVLLALGILIRSALLTALRTLIITGPRVNSLHYILSFSHEEYGKATSFQSIADKLRSKDSEYVPPPSVFHNATGVNRKANAAFVILARNSDLKSIIESIKHVEDRFNRKFGYPYVFLNEEPFSEEFKSWTSNVISTTAEYGLIPHEHWFQPDWIDEEKATKDRQVMEKENVIYGGSVPYRNMCRFNSGFFFRHQLLQKYKYYWRVEPGVSFFCDLHYDPFLVMQDEGKVYGFTISLYEYQRTIPTLWETTKKFIDQHPEYVSKENAMAFISDDNGKSYNLCHFWSNFEIGDLDFWRGEAYMKYFEFLDKAGGFYYERWGDAPVHSIGAALFARKDQIHFFREIGYRHNPFQHCPQGDAHKIGKCWCEEKDNFDYEGYSCTYRYDRLFT